MWRTLPAVIVTLILGVACFAALGLAVVSLAPSPAATQALANGSLILLAFISDIFVVTLPDWLDQIGWLFPLKHFVNAVADCFNPFLSGNGFAWDHLAVLALWGVAGALVAVRFFTWEPRPSRAHRKAQQHPNVVVEPEPADGAQAGRPSVSAPETASTATALISTTIGDGERSWWSLALAQARFTTIKLLRDPLSIFFAIVFPVILLVFFSAIYGQEATWGGLPLPQYLAAVFSVYGVAVMAYVNLSSTVAEDRAARILKRLRGTPLPPGAYLAGRIGAAAILGAITVAIVFGVGAIFFGVRVGLVGLLATTFAFAVVIGCAAALGLLLVSLVDSPQSVTAVALGTLLPLSMVSDIFINSPNLPSTMSAIGWAFPLRHMSNVAVAASSGQNLGAQWWGHIAVIALWGLVAAVIASRLFHWEPKA